jgi:hypothetical protein
MQLNMHSPGLVWWMPGRAPMEVRRGFLFPVKVVHPACRYIGKGTDLPYTLFL